MWVTKNSIKNAKLIRLNNENNYTFTLSELGVKPNEYATHKFKFIPIVNKLNLTSPNWGYTLDVMDTKNGNVTVNCLVDKIARKEDVILRNKPTSFNIPYGCDRVAISMGIGAINQKYINYLECKVNGVRVFYTSEKTVIQHFNGQDIITISGFGEQDNKSKQPMNIQFIWGGDVYNPQEATCIITKMFCEKKVDRTCEITVLAVEGDGV